MNKYFVIMLSILFALILGILGSISYTLSSKNDNARIQVLMAQETSNQLAAKKNIQSLLRADQSILETLVRNHIIHEFVSAENASNRDKTENTLLHYCTTYQVISQLRIINQDGFERARVNGDKGHCRVLATNELQDKSNRNYYKNSLSLKQNELYVSELDLNVEDGQVEVPHRPTLRMSMRIENSNDFLVMNLNPYEILTFALSEVSNDSNINNYLLNEDGYYLYSDNDKHREFAFMFNDMEDNFAKDFPTVWQALKDEKNISIDKHGLFILTKIDLTTLKDITHWSTNLRTKNTEAAWYLVRNLNQNDLYATSMFKGPNRHYWFVLLFTVSFIVAFLITLILNQRRENIDRLTTIIDASLDAIYVLDKEQNIVTYNPAFLQLLGYSDEDLRYLHPVHWNVELHAEASNQPYPSTHYVTQYQCKDGKILDVEVSSKQVKTHGQNLIYHYVKDITDLKAMLNELKIAKEEAETANVSKSLFLATMSHEIRTPLNAIIGTAYLLQHTNLKPEQKKDLTVIESSSKNLLGLINDILDFSKIEAGELSLNPQPFNIFALLDELHQLFITSFSTKGIELIIDEPDDNFPHTLVSDSMRLKQILVNFFSNALKFTDKGCVRITVELVSKDKQNDDKIWLRFAVSDTGIGIKPEVIPTLFSPFTQADNTTARKYGGTGLGLSISKQLAELLGGEIGVESFSKHGSTFWVNLPFSKSDTEIVQYSKVTFGHSINVLVTEDNEIDRLRIIQMCQDFGWNVESATNGQETIEIVLDRINQNKPFDCIIIDWRMPIKNGLTAINELHKQIEDEKFPSVIMVTADDYDNLLNSITDRKPDSILTKPFDPSILFNRVNEAIIAHGYSIDHLINMTVIEGNQCAWLKDMHIMAVDDSELNLEVISRILAKQGAKVECCLSAKEAIDELVAEPQKYDAILMDLQMPDMSGLEATKYIRETLELKELPIIALTADATSSTREEALKIGMGAILVKPADPDKIIVALRHQVEKHTGHPWPIIHVSSDTDLSAQPQAISFIEGIDTNIIATSFDGDQAFFQKLLNIYLKDNHNVLERVNSLLEEDKYAEAAKVIHKLRGQSANIGAMELFTTSSELEMALKNDSGSITELLTRLENQYTLLVDNATKWLQTKAIIEEES